MTRTRLSTILGLTAALGLMALAPAAQAAPQCFGKKATILAQDTNTIGTPGNDVIVGTPNPDTINGMGGFDRICGRAGDDTLFGGGGDDQVTGEGGDDQLDPTNDASAQGKTSCTATTASTSCSPAPLRPRGTCLFDSNGGNDELIAGNGDDAILAMDAMTDLVDGGDGTDDCVPDGQDDVRRCEFEMNMNSPGVLDILAGLEGREGR